MYRLKTFTLDSGSGVLAVGRRVLGSLLLVGLLWRAATPLAAAEPAGLAYLPENTVVVATVTPAELLARPELALVAKGLQGFEEPRGTLGIELTQIQRLTIVLLALEAGPGRSSPDMAGVFVQTTEPAGTAKIVQTLFATAETQEVGGRQVSVNPGGRPGCYFRIDDRTLLISRDVGNLQQMLAAGPEGPVGAKWVQEWNELATAPAAALLNVETIRDALTHEMQHAPPEIAPLVPVFSPLYLNARVLKLAVNFDRALSLTATLLGGTPDDGEKLAGVSQGAITLAQGVLEQSAGDVEKIPGEEGVLTRRAMSLATKWLERLKVARQGARVVITAELPADETREVVALLAPVLVQSREAARRSQSVKNLGQIALAMRDYHRTYGMFPPAILYGDDEATPYSWRVALLPYLGHAQLYNEYNRNESWDSEGNKRVLARMPAVFRSPGEPPDSTNACYFGLVGLDTVFVDDQAITVRDITDGASNTLLIVETKREIPWTKPADIPCDIEKELPKLGEFYVGGFHACLCDGAVRFLSDKIAPKTLRALITPDGGEAITGF